MVERVESPLNNSLPQNHTRKGPLDAHQQQQQLVDVRTRRQIHENVAKSPNGCVGAWWCELCGRWLSKADLVCGGVKFPPLKCVHFPFCTRATRIQVVPMNGFELN